MTQHYRCVYGGRASNNNSKHDDGTEKEITLVNIKGNCFKCGKPGHHPKDCHSSKSGGEKGKFKGMCHSCGMTGHAAMLQQIVGKRKKTRISQVQEVWK
jgi:hypothetical protein